jgi:hypothetical protein
LLATVRDKLEKKKKHRGGPCEVVQYRRFGYQIDRCKNREMGRNLALNGRRLTRGHNNQPKFGIQGGRVIGDDRRPGQNGWGVLSLRSGL